MELASTLAVERSTEPRERRTAVLTSLIVLLLVTTVIAAGYGALAISPGQVLAILCQHIGVALPWQFDGRQEHVLLAIRLPRVLLAILVGAGLSTSGTLMQGLFRNPLADPSLIGTSAGAALGGVGVIVLGSALLPAFTRTLGTAALPAAAFLGGLAATTLVYRISTAGSRSPLASTLLAGIAVNVLAGAAVGLLLTVADDAQLRTITFWNMGSLGGATWPVIAITAPMIVLSVLAAPRLARGLNALLLGDAEAAHLGIRVRSLKRSAIAISAVSVGASVAVAGMIGFVGLVAPHMIRLILGPDHRGVIPCAALLGAILLLCADLAARTMAAPAELPIGIVTSLIGAPLFLWLIMRGRSAEENAC